MLNKYTNSFAFGSMLDSFSGYILYFYINITRYVQIIRITNIPNYYWERTIFPGQRLIFEAITSAKLEIYTTESATAIPSDVIPCQQLRVMDELVSAKHSL